MTSSLYVGKVRHVRFQPFHHDFEYRVYYGMFDIDELERLDRRLRLFSLRRFNLFGFDEQKHGADERGLRHMVDALLADHGIDLEGGKVTLLAFPKVLGYVFDPISVWYCHGPEGELRAVIHEVRNTFGDKHLYVVPVDGADDLKHGFDKKLHVSPFNPMGQRYEFSMTEPGERLSVSISLFDERGLMFRAGLRLTRQPLTDRTLLRAFFKHPLVTLKAISAIHWQAVKLWRKGARYHQRPEPAERQVSLVTTKRKVA